MPNLPAKTRVANGTCACCGKPVAILLNKNGMAYYYCNWAGEDGPCSHHERWGRAASQKMQRDYLDARGKKDGNSDIPAPEAANENNKPARKQPDTPEKPATGGEYSLFGG